MKKILIYASLVALIAFSGCVKLLSSQEASRYNFVTGVDTTGQSLSNGYFIDIPYVYELLVVSRNERTFVSTESIRLNDGAKLSATVTVRCTVNNPGKYFTVFGIDSATFNLFVKDIASPLVAKNLARTEANNVLGSSSIRAIELAALADLTRSFGDAGIVFEGVSITGIKFLDSRYADRARRIGEIESLIITNRAQVEAKRREIDDRIATERGLRESRIALAREEGRRIGIVADKDATSRISAGIRAEIVKGAEARGIAKLRDGLSDDGASNLVLYEWSRMLGNKKIVPVVPAEKSAPSK